MAEKSSPKRVRDMIPPEVRHRTRSAKLPDADWYAGRPYERADQMEPIAIDGQAGVERRSEEAIEERRAHVRRQGSRFVRRIVAKVTGAFRRLRHPKRVQPQ